MSALKAVFMRELQLAARSRADWAQPVFFYILVSLLFPLGVAPNSTALPLFVPAILWMGALLAALLGLERVFRSDFEDGTLEQLFLAPVPVSFLVLGKLLAAWLVLGLPLALLSPLLGLLLGLSMHAAGVVMLGLLLGTLSLFFLGGFSSALLVGLPRAGVLLPVLVLPLVSPILIFGAGAARAAMSGSSAEAPLYFLAAIAVFCICLIPLATATALRNAFE
ncbi:MAG: heme exporter protein CcmB [Pseudomonadota bacterium]